MKGKAKVISFVTSDTLRNITEKDLKNECFSKYLSPFALSNTAVRYNVCDKDNRRYVWILNGYGKNVYSYFVIVQDASS